MGSFVAAVAGWSGRHRIASVILVVVVTLILGTQFQHFQVTADFASFLPSDSRALATLKRVEGAFGTSQFEFILVRQERAFDPADLEHIEPLATRVRVIEGIREVVAPSATPSPLNEQLLSEDRRAALLRVQVEPNVDPEQLSAALAEAVTEVELPEGMRAFATGPLAVEAELIKASQQDNGRLFGFALAAILVVVWLTFWRLRPLLIALSIVLLSVVWALGAVLATGQVITVISFSAILLIIALGIDYVIHFIRRVDEAHRLGEESPFEYAARTTGRSILLAVLTTVIGFLSFLTTGFPPIEQFGVVAAIGISAAFLLALLLIPALYVPAPTGARKGLADWVEEPLRVLGHSVARRARATWIGVAVLTAAAVIGLANVQVGSPPIRLETPAQLRLDELEQTFGAARTATILVDMASAETAPEGVGAAVSSRVRDLTESVAGLDGVRVIAPWIQSGSVAPIPGWVSGDLARIIVQYETDVAPQVTAALQQTLDAFEGIADLTGRDAIQAEIEGNVLGSLGASTSVAFAAILLVLTAFMRKLRLAVLTLFPMVLVIWWQLGTMPLLGIRLSTTTVTTAALVLGIGIDYAVHVLERLQEERAKGAQPADIVADVLGTTGPGIVSGALTTAAGFFILGSSHITNLRDYGLLTGVAVIYGLIVTLLVLPQVVVAVEARSARRVQRSEG